MTPSTPFLRLRGVGRHFSGRPVLKDIQLTILEGETVALVGHNGSGKSTLLKLIGGLLSLTDGERECSAGSSAVVGYVPDRFPKLKFTSFEYLTHMGRIRGIPADRLKRKITELHELLHLRPSQQTDMRNYSKGMLQKVNLMQALLVQPVLLLLDEPLTGLDSATQEELVGILSQMQCDGVTIIAATHEPVFVDQLASRIVKLEAGRITSDERKLPPQRIILPDRIINCFAAHDVLLALCDVDGVIDVEIYEESCFFRVKNGMSDIFLLTALQRGASILEVRTASDER